MNYLIYTRVSERGSKWEGETSCEAQAEECRRDIMGRDKHAKIEIAPPDEFVSGRTNDRPVLSKILATMDAATWDTLVVIDMDRLARSNKGWIQIAEKLAQHKKGLICVRQAADFSSIQGQMMLGLFSVLGEFFAKSNAQKTRDKMFHMARQGLYCPGVVPLGYVRKKKGDNALAIDPAPAAMVKDIFESYLAGESTGKLARRLDMHEDKIMRMLKNHTYTGRIIYGDIDAPGKHEAIIPPELFAAVQHRLPKTNRAPRPNVRIHEYLLSGLVRCSCGATMSASAATGGSGKSYPQYRCGDVRCKSTRKIIRADLLDKAVLEQISAKAESDKDIEKNYQRLTAMITTIKKQINPALESLRTELAPLEKKAANLSNAIQEGTLSREAIKGMAPDLDRLYGQIWVLKAEIHKQELQIDNTIAPDTVEQLSAAWRATARELINSTDATKRRNWIEHHIQTVTNNRGNDWCINFWTDKIGNVRASGGEWYPGRGSNARPAV